MDQKKPFNQSTSKFLIFLTVIILCWLAGKFFHFDQEAVKAYIGQFPPVLSGITYVALFVVFTFLIWFSKDLMMLIGGVLFGVYYSTILTWAAESINAVILFHLSRKLGREFVEQKTQGKLKGLDQRLATTSFLDLLALRAIILIPYRFLDLGYGLTNIPFKKYMTAVLLGSWPRLFMRQYFVIMVFNVVVGKNFKEMYQYLMQFVGERPYLTPFAFIYLAITLILFYRLKKILGG
jgi:uncharacterized membrane protein YdjX (TVP38/TMEM64 family)